MTDRTHLGSLSPLHCGKRPERRGKQQAGVASAEQNQGKHKLVKAELIKIDKITITYTEDCTISNTQNLI